jgi:hypothetical protein
MLYITNHCKLYVHICHCVRHVGTCLFRKYMLTKPQTKGATSVPPKTNYTSTAPIAITGRIVWIVNTVRKETRPTHLKVGEGIHFI